MLKINTKDGLRVINPRNVDYFYGTNRGTTIQFNADSFIQTEEDIRNLLADLDPNEFIAVENDRDSISAVNTARIRSIAAIGHQVKDDDGKTHTATWSRIIFDSGRFMLTPVSVEMLADNINEKEIETV